MPDIRKSLIACFAAVVISVHAFAQSPDQPAKSERIDRAMSAVVKALSNDRAFQKGEYKFVRGVFSKYFEDAYADEIKSGFGADHSQIMAWLSQNPEVKDLLFTAIDPETDHVEFALSVFKDLYNIGPDKLKPYAQLAVACSVVWDNPQCIYDYRTHQIRTRSELPDGVMTNRHIENYKYLIENDAALKGSAANLPWEFLVYVVNHSTPVSERSWAIANYLKRKAQIGTSYTDVKYDTEMLRSEMRNGPGKGECRISGRPYTLENLSKYGGVCAQQADFACRVAKSLGVPAEYVGGEGNSGGRHAWVMWVEIKSATKDKLDVALLSEGRYLLDQYYVGTLKDPKSGRDITDREMEMSLVAIVNAPNAGRQADLLMRAFPVVKDKKQYTPLKQLEYIKKVIEIYNFNDRAWSERAGLLKSGALSDAIGAVNVSDMAIRVFQNHPDFSWKYADDLLTPVKDKQIRARQFEKMVSRYEQLGRPDLACEARLRLAEYQADAKDFKAAADGLSKTIAKFPAEGRYVPKMLERLQEVCREYKGGTEKLTKFYLQLLPLIPPTRGTEASEYCIKVHERALEFFKKNSGNIQDIRQIETRLDVLKRNSPKGS